MWSLNVLLCTSPSWFCEHILSLTWRLLNLSIICIKPLMFLFGPHLHFPQLISTYVLSHMKCPRIFQFWILITCEYSHECCCLINSPTHDINAPLCPSLAVLKNNRYISSSYAKKFIFISLILLLSLSFRILNLNPAIPFFPSFPAHYLNLVFPSMS